MKLKKTVIIVLSIALLFVIIGGGLYIYNLNFSIDFEQIEELSCKEISADEKQKWFSLRHEDYKPFYSADMLDNYGVKSSEINFDFKNYTYIVTIGHKLKKIEYSYSTMKNRTFFVIPKQFVGHVVLNSKLNNNIYIYRINKMDIDCNYHNPSEYVIFE